MEGKKTYLLLTAARKARRKDRELVLGVLRNGGRAMGSRSSVVPAMTAVYRRYGIIDAAQRLIRENTYRATVALAELPPARTTETLAWLAHELVHRSS
jgi:geranylgeranyl pyrophosphate synthase